MVLCKYHGLNNTIFFKLLAVSHDVIFMINIQEVSYHSFKEWLCTLCFMCRCVYICIILYTDVYLLNSTHMRLK